jgi:biopolymer transport protein ExbD
MKTHGTHYLALGQSLWLPFFALAINILALAVFTVEIRAMRQNLQLEFASGRLPAPQANIPVVQIDPGPALQINGERLATLGDLEYRLEGAARGGSRVTIRAAAGVSADVLGQVLEICSRAGFTSVAIDTGG